MDITFYNNRSEKNKINKTLETPFTLSGDLKGETSVINPVIMIEHGNPTGYNYAYIPEFNRYYFISEITSVRTGLWRVSMVVDVLMSFKTQIMNVPVILSDSEEHESEMYLTGDVWQTKVKETTNIKTFPNGLSEDGYFILITAGG